MRSQSYRQGYVSLAGCW